MNPPDWLNRSVSRLSGLKNIEKVENKAQNVPAGQLIYAQTAIKPIAISEPQIAGRSTRDRLKATLRQKEEALSLRVLRRTLEELRAIIDPQVSEVEGGIRAKGWHIGTRGPRPMSGVTCGC